MELLSTSASPPPLSPPHQPTQQTPHQPLPLNPSINCFHQFSRPSFPASSARQLPPSFPFTISSIFRSHHLTSSSSHTISPQLLSHRLPTLSTLLTSSIISLHHRLPSSSSIISLTFSTYQLPPSSPLISPHRLLPSSPYVISHHLPLVPIQYEVHVAARTGGGGGAAGGERTQGRVNLLVGDVNDNPPFLTRPFYETQVTEEDDRHLPKTIVQVGGY